MKLYKKPYVLSTSGSNSLIPAAVAAVSALLGGTTATAAVGAAGAAFAVGVASGLMKDNKFPTTALPAIERVV